MHDEANDLLLGDRHDSVKLVLRNSVLDPNQIFHSHHTWRITFIGTTLLLLIIFASATQHRHQKGSFFRNG